jgi:hypothetical protein
VFFLLNAAPDSSLHAFSAVTPVRKKRGDGGGSAAPAPGRAVVEMKTPLSANCRTVAEHHVFAQVTARCAGVLLSDLHSSGGADLGATAAIRPGRSASVCKSAQP